MGASWAFYFLGSLRWTNYYASFPLSFLWYHWVDTTLEVWLQVAAWSRICRSGTFWWLESLTRLSYKAGPFLLEEIAYGVGLLYSWRKRYLPHPFWEFCKIIIYYLLNLDQTSWEVFMAIIVFWRLAVWSWTTSAGGSRVWHWPTMAFVERRVCPTHYENYMEVWLPGKHLSVLFSFGV